MTKRKRDEAGVEEMEAAEAAEGRSSPGTPTWVKISVIVGILLVLLLVVRLVGSGEHGPGRHAPTGENPVFWKTTR